MLGDLDIWISMRKFEFQQERLQYKVENNGNRGQTRPRLFGVVALASGDIFSGWQVAPPPGSSASYLESALTLPNLAQTQGLYTAEHLHKAESLPEELKQLGVLSRANWFGVGWNREESFMYAGGLGGLGTGKQCSLSV